MPRPLYVEVGGLLTPPLTGIGRFCARLIEALARAVPLRLFIAPEHTDQRLRAGRSALAHGAEIAVPAGSLPETNGDLDAWVHRLLARPGFPLDWQRASACACLYPVLRPDRRYFAREVSILYDFTPLLLPATHLPETRAAFGDFFATTVARSDKAVALSRATWADARWLCALPHEDVVVGSPGPSLCVGPHAHAGGVERSDRLVLVVAKDEPRKNMDFLRQWFFATRCLAPDMQLWCVGPRRHWWWRPSRRNGRRFRHLGLVSDRQLCALYRRATVTICASLYEGFGFPVLDALLHGTPVVCSFNSALKEFAGPGVFYFDPCDRRSLDCACREVSDAMPVVFDRSDLRARCSWDVLARTVAALCA